MNTIKNGLLLLAGVSFCAVTIGCDQTPTPDYMSTQTASSTPPNNSNTTNLPPQSSTPPPVNTQDMTEHAVYNFYASSKVSFSGTTYTGLDLDYSISSNSPASGYKTIGIAVTLFSSSSSTRVVVYLCSASINGTPTHFASTSCGSSTNSGSLGFLESQPTGLATNAVYECTGAPVITGVNDGGQAMAYVTGGLLTTNTALCVSSSPKTLLGYIY